MQLTCRNRADGFSCTVTIDDVTLQVTALDVTTGSKALALSLNDDALVLVIQPARTISRNTRALNCFATQERVVRPDLSTKDVVHFRHSLGV